MLAIQITSTKQFMNHLLTGNCFSSFLLENAVIKTFNTFTIDGRVHTDFFDKEDEDFSEKSQQSFSKFMDIQDYLFHIIKGKRTPLSIKLTLLLMRDSLEKILQKDDCTVSSEEISDFVLNIKYDGSKILITTGISYSGFTLDKSAETLWDNAFKKFLVSKEIAFEEMI